MRRLVMVAVATTVVGCVDEREAFRADALDVAGQWRLTSPTIDAAVVDISVETDVNDIRAVLRRGDGIEAVSIDEAEVISRLRNINDRLLVHTALELGTGTDVVRTELTGGENVSFDGGSTASVDVVSGAYAARTEADDSLVRWGLSLTGNDDELSGELFVTERRRTHTIGTTDTDLTTQRSAVEITLTRAR